MSRDSENNFDPEVFMRRVEEMLLMDEITKDQKIEVLRNLLAIGEGKSKRMYE